MFYRKSSHQSWNSQQPQLVLLCPSAPSLEVFHSPRPTWSSWRCSAIPALCSPARYEDSTYTCFEISPFKVDCDNLITPELPVRKISHDLPYQVILTQSAFHYKLEPKSQVTWTTRCKAMAKYISIYFDIFYKKLDDFGLPPARSKTNIYSLMINIWLLVALILQYSPLKSPLKKCLFQKMWFFVVLGFPSVILANKLLSFKMVFKIFSTSFHCGLIDV